MTKLAQQVEITPSHLSNLEAGRRQASPEVLRDLARILGVPLAAIVSDFTPEEIAAS